MAELLNREDLTLREEEIKKVGERNTCLDGKMFKKSPSVWLFQDYPCEACDKTFM